MNAICKKILQALNTLRKRFDRIAIRQGYKGDGGDNKGGGGGNNGDIGSGGGNHNTSGKNDNKENNANSGNEKWIYTKGMEYDPMWTYKKRQCFNKERNLANKKSRRKDKAHWKKNKRARLEKYLAALGE